MTGKVFWTFIYINDSVSSWTAQEKQRQEKINLDVIQYLKENAKFEQINLHMFIKTYDVCVPCEVNRDTFAEWTGYCAKAIGGASLPAIDDHLMRKHPGCQNFYIFLLNKPGRSYASPSVTYPASDSEYCIIYEREFYTLLHEALHVFGAADYYYPEQVRQAATHIIGDCVMLTRSCMIDDLTRYLIGWRDTPSKQAQLLLDATSYITRQMVEQGLQARTKSGTGRIVLSNGTIYEGTLKEGIPEGKGKLIYKDGSVYEGEISMAEPHGYGILQFASGTRYEGEFSHNKIEGKGHIRYSNGVVRKGYFENGEYKGKGFFGKPPQKNK